MAERATAEIRPVKLREYVAEMHCDVLRVIGHRVKCRCGWKSSVMPTVGAARTALANHRAGGHAAKPEAASATRETAA